MYSKSPRVATGGAGSILGKLLQYTSGNIDLLNFIGSTPKPDDTVICVVVERCIPIPKLMGLFGPGVKILLPSSNAALGVHRIILES